MTASYASSSFWVNWSESVFGWRGRRVGLQLYRQGAVDQRAKGLNVVVCIHLGAGKAYVSVFNLIWAAISHQTNVDKRGIVGKCF